MANHISMNLIFSLSATTVDVYDYTEVCIETNAVIAEPFLSVAVTASFGRPSEERLSVGGFCDAQDGSVYRVRFLPMVAGEYDFTVTFRHGDHILTKEGHFTARASVRKGLLRTDADYPFHFQWSGTEEHFFYNSTTAYCLAGWEEPEIEHHLERLHKREVNRVRVALSPPRVLDGQTWKEPVYPSARFTFLYGPWLTARPESVDDPGWDVTRFNITYWRKFERLLQFARQRDMVVSVIFYVDGQRPGSFPFDRENYGSNPDEENYYRYAVARLAAFSNVCWDITNEWKLFRNDDWVNQMGNFLRSCDPYHHLTTVHGHGDFPFRASSWADYAQFQSWDEHGGYDFMMKNRAEQIATGRPIPQINEEYGYEDHYPIPWGEARVAPARNPDSRRRLAWEIVMAGCYQTTGEYAGDGIGGWINGGGDDRRTMLTGYAYIKQFFETFDWWRLEPSPEIITGRAFCLTQAGERSIVYLPNTDKGSVSIVLSAGTYTAAWYNPRTGESDSLEPLTASGESGESWQIPPVPDSEDWVLHLTAAN